MLILISPAKTLDYQSPLATERYTQPELLDYSQQLIHEARKLSAPQIASLMSISDKLADLNANVEGNQVDKQAIGRDFEFLDFGCQTKTVEESKDERRKLRVGLNAKPALECPEVIKRFIDHGQPDNGVNKVSTDADIKEGADEQRR